MTDGKHVIFLGAGASASSGYPLARELTKLMADRLHFFNHVRRLLAREESTIEQAVYNVALGLFDSFAPAAKLLKEGSFATMDELSNLAFGGQRAGDVLALKRLLRLIFALDNPDIWHWGASDYPHFINALFGGREVPRDDVCILSFNYDPYLDFLLFSALRARHSLKGVGDDKMRYLKQAVTSGFFDPGSVDWLEIEGFSHLKLHGVAALPNTPPRVDNKIFHWMHLFDRDIRRRCVNCRELGHQDPPVLLPWEIIHPADSKVLDEAEFRRSVGTSWQHSELYPLFAGIWKRARNEIQNARKVSFVGMSMAALYEPELRYLFHERRLDKPLQLLSVSPGNKTTREGGTGIPLDRVTPAGKLYHFLRDVLLRDPFAAPKRFGPVEGFEQSVGVDWAYEFSEFITLHMD